MVACARGPSRSRRRQGSGRAHGPLLTGQSPRFHPLQLTEHVPTRASNPSRSSRQVVLLWLNLTLGTFLKIRKLAPLLVLTQVAQGEWGSPLDVCFWLLSCEKLQVCEGLDVL